MEKIKSWAGPGGAALFLVGGLVSLVVERLNAVWILVMVLGAALGIAGMVAARRPAGRGSALAAKRGANAAATIVLTAAIVFMVGAISARHSRQVDLTSGGRYSLSPQSAKIVGGLAKDVEAICFYKETTPQRRELEDLLAEFRHAGHRFSYRFVDPDRNPGEAKAHQVTNYGETILVCGTREERVMGSEERDVTNGLIKVTREGKKKFYFLSGHGEHATTDSGKDGLASLKTELERENFDTAELTLMRADKVPDDCAALVIAGPKSDLFPPEIEALKKYLDGGGKMLAMLEPAAAPDFRGLPNLEGFLATWGVKLGPDIIIDRMSRLFGGDYLIPIVTEYEDHPITRNFKLASFFPTARSVDLTTPLPPGVKATKIALTGKDAWAEMDQAGLVRDRKAKYDEGVDKMGPVPVVSAFTKPAAGAAPPDSAGGARETRLVVFGDSDIATNTNVGLSGNADLIMNTMGWLGEEEDLVAIRPKESKNEPIILSATQGRMIFYLPVVGLPLATLILGASVVARRRWRR